MEHHIGISQVWEVIVFILTSILLRISRHYLFGFLCLESYASLNGRRIAE
jgi:hypothetical protein